MADANKDPILCPHPSGNDLEVMVRKEREAGVTDDRLRRARWCSGCRVMLSFIET